MKKLILLLIIAFSASVVAQIDKMEPPFWYEGMNKSEVQILFYGKNIAENTVSISNNVVITNVTKTENPNYIFVTIDTKNVSAQSLKFTFKKGKKSFTKDFEIKKRRENSANRKSFDASDVMYLLMPDRFANGNASNDSSPKLQEKANRSLPGGRHGGDVQGIIDHLDYIQELGATAIWSTPMCEDNDKGYSYHTYGQSDVYQIDARYGSNEDYKRLAAEMHKRDMKLIKDYVTNHWGAEHWMFKDMPTYDWFHQFPGYAQSNYRMTTQYDTNASKRDAKYCMDGWFVPSMPDLNQSNPLVLNYLIQNAIWWIEYADLDGYRVDTYSYNDKEGIAKWTKAITDEYPYFNIVGEVWMHDQAQISYWQKNSPIAKIQSYNSYLPSVMDFTMHDAFGNVFNEDNASWSDGMIKFYDNLANDFLYDNTNNLLIFLENHDTGRFNQIYKNDFKKYQLGMTLLATMRGIPQLYYGSEIGMAGDKGKGDADIRQDFPGGWKGDTNNAFSASGRTAEQAKYFDFSKKVLNWRKNKEVIHTGKLTHYIPENNVYVYFRHNDSETVMVIINNSKDNQKVNLSRFEENVKNFTSGKDILSNQNFDLKQELSIEGKTSLILELK
ncbi:MULTISPECIES: glycoside hydrolase family 13 protein [unclassified Flavobacterium]|uniref:glycoside hydrolase family 13 protein n=1 Tax=unclassified Flavobacterium TaxID=196869 RepID=UPI0012922BFC|nr:MULTISPECIES: glycoside hydrolase family 13 protein [unclassified Flavobacterium]MQP52672.1 alpha-amylase [Flavobacterium sp. LMO9]MQP62148.1 alpha-amylase [Flavobacterium sp. LMO6]